MKKNSAHLLAVFILVSTSCFSQSWQWAQRFGSDGNDVAFNVSADSKGNCYVTGEFRDTVMFGNTQLTNPGNNWDMFFTKLDSSGNVLWALNYGGNGNDYGFEIIADAFGNCYLVGAFEDSLIIGNYTLISVGSKDIFLAKIDSNLNVVWAKRGGGTGSDEPFSIRLDNAGNIYMITPFLDPAYFDADTLISVGGYDIALVKYDNNGTVIWAKGAGGPGTDVPYSISIDLAGNIIMGGHFSNTCSFDSNSVTSLGWWDTFIAKYDSAGNALWVRSAGSPGDDGNTVVRVGTDNSIYVAGMFSNIMTLGSLSLITVGSPDIFVAKCDSVGTFLWANQAGSANADMLLNMALDQHNSMYITGYYGGNAMFGSIAVAGNFDVFIAKYDSSGSAQWVKNAMGPGGQQSQIGWGIAESNNNIFVTGSFENELSFDNSPLSFPSAGSNDIFVAKINQVPTGIIDLNMSKNTIAIFPNPASALCTVTSIVQHQGTLTLYDITGRQLLQQDFNGQVTINVSGLQAGIYLVEVMEMDKKVRGKLVVK